MKKFLFFSFLALITISMHIHSHGFDTRTIVRMTHEWRPLWCLAKKCDIPKSEKIQSYDFAKEKCVNSAIEKVAQARINCYVRFGFDRFPGHDIKCSPMQLFYLPKKNAWIPAFKLQVGDVLLSKCTELIAITHRAMIHEPLKVYALELKEPHNYLVGSYCVLTHNVGLDQIFLFGTVGINIAFGEGAVPGAAAGAAAGIGGLTGGAAAEATPTLFTLGPVGIGIGIGIIVGGLIGFGIKYGLGKDKIPEFEFTFNADNANAHFQNEQTKENREQSHPHQGSAEATGGPEDPKGPKDDKSACAPPPPPENDEENKTNECKNDGLKNQTVKQLEKGVRSLEKQIKEHEQKIEQFIKDPYSLDNKGIYKKAATDEIRNNIFNERIKKWNQEINKFKLNIQDCLREIKLRKKE